MKRVLYIFILGLIACSGHAGGMSGQEGRSNDPQLVIGRTWRWEATVNPLEKITVSEPGRYTIMLAADGRIQIRLDCNRGGGEYKIAEGMLSFSPLISTRMACPADSMDGPFIRDLQRVTSFFIEGGKLFLELPYDSGTMIFGLHEKK